MGCSSPLLRPWACRWINHLSLWQPVWRQTYSYLPSCRTSLLRDWHQIILLGDRGTCVNNLPKVITWQWNGQELNSWPIDSQANILIITPLGHTHSILWTNFITAHQGLVLWSSTETTENTELAEAAAFTQWMTLYTHTFIHCVSKKDTTHSPTIISTIVVGLH